MSTPEIQYAELADAETSLHAGVPSSEGPRVKLAADPAVGGEHSSDIGGDDPAHRVVQPTDVWPEMDADVEILEHVGTGGSSFGSFGGGGGTVNSSGRKLTLLSGLEACPRLRELHVRSNLLRRMLGVRHCPALEVLELYDNRIEKVEDLGRAKLLRVLDLSYNCVRAIEVEPAESATAAVATAAAAAEAKTAATVHSSGSVASDSGLGAAAPSLEELYLAANRLERMAPGLARCTMLRVLDLGGNRIRAIEGMTALTSLTDLWLGKNRIVRMEGLEALNCLRRLDLQSNRLTAIAGLSALAGLRELYLGHNSIARIEGLSHLVELTTLDLTANRIEVVEGLAGCSSLEDLWMSENRVADWAGISHELTGLQALTTVYFEHNPIAREWDYRIRMRRTLPQLLQIDAVTVPTTHSQAEAAKAAAQTREQSSLADKERNNA